VEVRDIFAKGSAWADIVCEGLWVLDDQSGGPVIVGYIPSRVIQLRV
jgi:hypothetical protein